MSKFKMTSRMSQTASENVWWTEFWCFLFVFMHYPNLVSPGPFVILGHVSQPPHFTPVKQILGKFQWNVTKCSIRTKLRIPWFSIGHSLYHESELLSLQIKFRISFRLFQNLKTLKISILWWFKCYHLAMAYNLHIIRAKAKSSALFNRLNQKGFWYIVMFATVFLGIKTISIPVFVVIKCYFMVFFLRS